MIMQSLRKLKQHFNQDCPFLLNEEQVKDCMEEKEEKDFAVLECSLMQQPQWITEQQLGFTSTLFLQLYNPWLNETQMFVRKTNQTVILCALFSEQFNQVCYITLEERQYCFWLKGIGQTLNSIQKQVSINSLISPPTRIVHYFLSEQKNNLKQTTNKNCFDQSFIVVLCATFSLLMVRNGLLKTCECTMYFIGNNDLKKNTHVIFESIDSILDVTITIPHIYIILTEKELIQFLLTPSTTKILNRVTHSALNVMYLSKEQLVISRTPESINVYSSDLTEALSCTKIQSQGISTPILNFKHYNDSNVIENSSFFTWNYSFLTYWFINGNNAEKKQTFQVDAHILTVISSPKGKSLLLETKLGFTAIDWFATFQRFQQQDLENQQTQKHSKIKSQNTLHSQLSLKTGILLPFRRKGGPVTSILRPRVNGNLLQLSDGNLKGAFGQTALTSIRSVGVHPFGFAVILAFDSIVKAFLWDNDRLIVWQSFNYTKVNRCIYHPSGSHLLLLTPHCIILLDGNSLRFLVSFPSNFSIAAEFTHFHIVSINNSSLMCYDLTFQNTKANPMHMTQINCTLRLLTASKNTAFVVLSSDSILQFILPQKKIISHKYDTRVTALMLGVGLVLGCADGSVRLHFLPFTPNNYTQCRVSSSAITALFLSPYLYVGDQIGSIFKLNVQKLFKKISLHKESSINDNEWMKTNIDSQFSLNFSPYEEFKVKNSHSTSECSSYKQQLEYNLNQTLQRFNDQLEKQQNACNTALLLEQHNIGDIMKQYRFKDIPIEPELVKEFTEWLFRSKKDRFQLHENFQINIKKLHQQRVELFKQKQLLRERCKEQLKMIHMQITHNEKYVFQQHERSLMALKMQKINNFQRQIKPQQNIYCCLQKFKKGSSQTAKGEKKVIVEAQECGWIQSGLGWCSQSLELQLNALKQNFKCLKKECSELQTVTDKLKMQKVKQQTLHERLTKEVASLRMNFNNQLSVRNNLKHQLEQLASRTNTSFVLKPNIVFLKDFKEGQISGECALKVWIKQCLENEMQRNSQYLQQLGQILQIRREDMVMESVQKQKINTHFNQAQQGFKSQLKHTGTHRRTATQLTAIKERDFQEKIQNSIKYQGFKHKQNLKICSSNSCVKTRKQSVDEEYSVNEMIGRKNKLAANDYNILKLGVKTHKSGLAKSFCEHEILIQEYTALKMQNHILRLRKEEMFKRCQGQKENELIEIDSQTKTSFKLYLEQSKKTMNGNSQSKQNSQRWLRTKRKLKPCVYRSAIVSPQCD